MVSDKQIESKIEAYLESILLKDEEQYLDLISGAFVDRIQPEDLVEIFKLNNREGDELEIKRIHSAMWHEEEDYNNGKTYHQLEFSFDIENLKTGENFTEKEYVFIEINDGDVYFIPYLKWERKRYKDIIPNSLMNEILSKEEKKYTTQITLFPDFEEVFIEGTDPLVKYCFLPFATLKITNHEEIGDKVFHFVSAWDTGDYEECQLGENYIDAGHFEFDMVNDKLTYKDEVKFPHIAYLKQAYEIIEKDFENNQSYYLEDVEHSKLEEKIKRGSALILEKIPNFDPNYAEYYYKWIISYLVGKWRYKKYGVLNGKLTNSSEIENFNTSGRSEDDFIENILLLHDYIEAGDLFIGNLYEAYYNTHATADINIFYDKEREKQIQIIRYY